VLEGSPGEADTRKFRPNKVFGYNEGEKKTDLGYARQQTSGEAGAQGGRANSRRPWHSQYPGALLYADGAVPKAEFPRGKIRLGGN
jgi:hypothetical protein